MDRDDQIIRDYLAGLPMPAIRGKNRVTAATVYNVLKRRGVSPRGRVAPYLMPPINLPTDEIIERYQSGESAVQIAARYGVSNQTITARLRGRVKIRQGQEVRRKLTDEQLLGIWESGETDGELAKKMGVSESLVRAVKSAKTIARRAAAAKRKRNHAD